MNNGSEIMGKPHPSVFRDRAFRLKRFICAVLIISAFQLAAQEKPRQYTIFDSTQAKSLQVYMQPLTSDRFWVVTTDYMHCGIVDADHKVVVPVTFYLQLLHEDVLAACDTGNKCGYIDVNGVVKLPFVYRSVGSFSDGIAFVTDSAGQKIFIDHEGRKQFAGDYDMVDEFVEGLAMVFKGSRKGFINRRGRLVVPIKYADATRFKNGRARVRIGDDYFIINRHGKIKAKDGHVELPNPL